ncbi:ArsR/SmtB family transcription factor [Candidatus Macondimonas diazotrophica]|jgi:DNA-binding transcriptional ArsR family regulator|uniref:Transcriptional regulator n=1 Tax=Candidatus Macondimonas diazotrophica TaxID=2305248 RepID=A0A4Z0FBD1_9GAMM|nr:metalloregulator ArsR/SmtB family transcription factor [Candidatus Macondimonas diazotrophica]NCT99999.1 helix-turn-helix transcriptional regulator [Candidatus Macondimonas diazotrophica]TFZ83795.1 transcriptional regulator [Candidatus Macondimonas diazotrophica]HBG31446.1 transcriptional regulator [Gammaproteobacteria bacterium]HBG51875.1 transcriptional regulator [Gammaproteobacteria bacterium]
MNETDALHALGALAHGTRLGIFRLLIQESPDGLPAGMIAERLNVLQNTLSAHLRILEQARLIKGTRMGRSIRYTADHAAMQALLTYLLADCCQGDLAICAPLMDVLSCPAGAD